MNGLCKWHSRKNDEQYDLTKNVEYDKKMLIWENNPLAINKLKYTNPR